MADTMANIEFALMQDYHLPTVFELEESLFAGEEWSRDQFYSELALVPASRMYWVALHDKRVIGYFGEMIVDDFADIATVALAPEYRRQGIATRMVDTMIAEAVRRGATRMLLEVRTDNTAAIALYKKLGFDFIAERPNYYGPGLSAYVMERKNLVSND
jgi:ribosomal-protein-alanine N-acetyltransferase